MTIYKYDVMLNVQNLIDSKNYDAIVESYKKK